MGKLLKMQPILIHSPAKKDIVYTPDWLACDIVKFYKPSGFCLDPCKGGGAFLKYLPAGSDYCEIEEGRDFYSYTKKVKWIISNPPYSHLLAWIRYSFKIAENIVYLIYGTGTIAGFDFGNALGAVYYKKGYHGSTEWSFYK